MKQMGDMPILDGEPMWYGKKGKEIERWPENLRIREFPVARVAID